MQKLVQVNALNFFFFQDVGFLVASPYAALQIHYSVCRLKPLFCYRPHFRAQNPSLGSWIDRSGVRIHLTPMLRPHNAAWGTLGQFVQQIKLAPGIAYPNKHLTISGSCHGKQLDDWTANGDLHVFAYRMHAHLLGRKVVTQQWRDGS